MSGLPLTRDTRLERTDNALSSQLGDRAIVMGLDDGRYHELDAVGTVVWTLMEQPTTLGELVERLTQKFDVDEATCRADVQELLERLHELGFVQAG